MEFGGSCDNRKAARDEIKELGRPSTLSPLRYPGGKTWLRGWMLDWLRGLPQRPEVFVEPFAGGASVGLAVAECQLAHRVVLVELDPEVAALWSVIFSDHWQELAKRITAFVVLRADARRLLADENPEPITAAFRCLLRNRLQRGGIMAPGANLLRKGENNRGLASRWYPETLVQRLSALQSLRDRIHFVSGDGLQMVAEYADRKTAAFFVDPPYLANGEGPGKRLYRHNDIDHERIFAELASVRGHFVLCYHDNVTIRRLAREHGFQFSSIQMRNTHHQARRELLIYRQIRPQAENLR